MTVGSQMPELHRKVVDDVFSETHFRDLDYPD